MIEAGLLTPTLTVQRDVVQRMFAREINALCADPLRSRSWAQLNLEDVCIDIF